MIQNESQIKAARAFLNWTQDDLAKRAGVSAQTIISIEKAVTPLRSARGNTINNIAEAFEREGIIFTATGGVDIKSDIATPLTGPDWFDRILDDVYYTLLDKRDAEILTFGSDDALNDEKTIGYIHKIRNAGIRMRDIIKAGNTCMMGSVSDYRWIKPEYFQNYIKTIYGNKVVLDFGDTGLLIKNEHLAAVERNQFNLIWDSLPSIEVESTADVRY